MRLTMEEITEELEKVKEGAMIKFSLPEIFGGGVAAIGLNPEKGGKKYILKLGNDEKSADESKPYWESNKAKDIADWVEHRLGDKIE